MLKRFLEDALDAEALENIQYVGVAGVSASCYNALKRYVQYGDRIERARLLTANSFHAFQLTTDELGTVFVKSGFTSGYSGEGPRTLAQALMLLHQMGIDPVNEIEISPSMLNRLNQGRLSQADLRRLDATEPIRPLRTYDYVYPYRSQSTGRSELNAFPIAMPWSIIDERLIGIAIGFEDDPDRAIFSAFRELEEIVRLRTGLTESGVKLFSQAFALDVGPLYWGRQEAAEEKGMAQLFFGTYMAYRNPRAHRPLGASLHDSLAEFLLVNHLFRLERAAIDRPALVGKS